MDSSGTADNTDEGVEDSGDEEEATADEDEDEEEGSEESNEDSNDGEDWSSLEYKHSSIVLVTRVSHLQNKRCKTVLSQLTVDKMTMNKIPA